MKLKSREIENLPKQWRQQLSKYAYLLLKTVYIFYVCMCIDYIHKFVST